MNAMNAMNAMNQRTNPGSNPGSNPWELSGSQSGTGSPLEARIRAKLTAAFAPEHLTVENESHLHSVPEGTAIHFRVLIVSALFLGKSRIERQRWVNEVLKEEFALGREHGGLHALAQRALSPDEWRAEPVVMDSPPCHRGLDHDPRALRQGF